jgi:mRNA-degrading endonuclease toxin of MazEF toxin-antitoxin module
VIVGDIHWVQLPAANGREQRGRRPAVILQDDQYAGGLPVVLVIPLTTARAAMRFAGTALIRPTAVGASAQLGSVASACGKWKVVQACTSCHLFYRLR